MSNQTLTRKELYDLVWSTPFTTLLKRYAITDTGLRKICTKMEIPLPKSGYWEKVRFNKPVEKGSLSNDYSGDSEVILSLRVEGEVANVGIQSPLTILENEITKKEGALLEVPERLTNPDKLIIAAKESLTRSRAYLTEGGLVNTSINEMSIKVSPKNVNRALRFMDTFIKVINNRGHKILVGYKLSYIVIGEEKIEINFREKTKRNPNQNDNSWQRYLATGILTFNAKIHWNNVEWKDGKLPLEKQLAKIIAKLELEGERLKDQAIQREIVWAEREEQRRIKEEKENLKKMEAAKFKKLLQNSKQWQEANIIHNYLNETEAKAKSDNNLSEEKQAWILWARKKADWYDPLIAASDDLLNENDKENLNDVSQSKFY